MEPRGAFRLVKTIASKDVERRPRVTQSDPWAQGEKMRKGYKERSGVQPIPSQATNFEVSTNRSAGLVEGSVSESRRLVQTCRKICTNQYKSKRLFVTLKSLGSWACRFARSAAISYQETSWGKKDCWGRAERGDGIWQYWRGGKQIELYWIIYLSAYIYIYIYKYIVWFQNAGTLVESRHRGELWGFERKGRCERKNNTTRQVSMASL